MKESCQIKDWRSNSYKLGSLFSVKNINGRMKGKSLEMLLLEAEKDGEEGRGGGGGKKPFDKHQIKKKSRSL